MSPILTPRTLEAGSAILTTAALPSQEVHSSDAFAQPEPTEERECRFCPSRSSWTCEGVENVPGELPGGESVLAVQPPTPHLLFTTPPITCQARGTCPDVTGQTAVSPGPFPDQESWFERARLVARGNSEHCRKGEQSPRLLLLGQMKARVSTSLLPPTPG